MAFRYMGEDPSFKAHRAMRPTGRPEVPDEYERLLLDEPVD
jgi:hypothetical protein